MPHILRFGSHATLQGKMNKHGALSPYLYNRYAIVDQRSIVSLLQYASIRRCHYNFSHAYASTNPQLYQDDANNDITCKYNLFPIQPHTRW